MWIVKLFVSAGLHPSLFVFFGGAAAGYHGRRWTNGPLVALASSVLTAIIQLGRGAEPFSLLIINTIAVSVNLAISCPAGLLGSFLSGLTARSQPVA